MRNSTYLQSKTVSSGAFIILTACVFLFPLVSAAQTPGGVSTNLKLWLTAGAGTNTTTDADSVTSWLDQSTSAFSFTVDHTNGPAAPTFVSNSINFNPSVSYLTTAVHSIPALTGPALYNSTVYVVGKPTAATDGNNSIWVANNAGSDVIWAPYLNGSGLSVFDQANGTPSFSTFSWVPDEISYVSQRVSGTDAIHAKQGAPEQTLSGQLPNNGEFYSLGNNIEPVGGSAGSEPFGLVSETLIYNTASLTARETERIESYLSLKYGISLDQTNPRDYLASDDATIMWDGLAGLTVHQGYLYQSGIFGIGKDAGSGLDQRVAQSAAADGGSLLTLATTNDFTSTNLDASRVSLPDLNFETVSNNNGTAAWTTTNALTGYNILNRQWLVHETGSIGNIFLQFDVDNAGFDVPALLGGAAYYLITDPNGDGDYSDGTAIALTNTSGSLWSTSIDLGNNTMFTLATRPSINAGPDRGACVNGGKIYLTGLPNTGTWSEKTGNPAATNLGSTTIPGVDSVNFITPGVYYFIYTNGTDTDTMNVTVASCAAPGGVVSHLSLWLKADAGTGTTTDGSPVTGWSDTTANALALPGGGNPLYVANSINYNPSVLYGTTDYNTMPVAIPTANSTVFMAGMPQAASSADGFNDAWITADEADYPLIVTSGEVGHYGNGENDAYPWSFNDPSFAREHIFNGYDVSISKQGAPAIALPSAAFNSSSYYYLGSDPNASEGFGNIAETFIYDTSGLAATDIQKIESYLGLKYGVTLDNTAGGTAGSYLLSNSTTAWDASVNPGYQHGVIGLAKNNISALLQKQSHSKDDSLRIFTGSVAVSNAANAGTITNDVSAVIIGNDGGQLQGTTTLAQPAGIYSRFGRTWKVTNTNFTDNFSLEFKWDSVGAFSLSDIRLLVSASPDFSAATVYDNSAVTFSLGSIVVSGISTTIIPANTTMYLTIGSVSPLTPLPLTLTDFNANAINNNSVALSWQTSAEINNNYFTVQKSADGNVWKDVTQVKGSGTTTVAHNYAATDNSPYKGVSYYRLKQTDLDGKFTYSVVRTVNISNTLFSIYPNPVLSSITIEGTAAELSNVRIYNMTGQDVTSLTKLIDASSTRITIDMSHLNRGMYTIKTATAASKISKQ